MLSIYSLGAFGRSVADVLTAADPQAQRVDDPLAAPRAPQFAFCSSALHLARFKSIASSFESSVAGGTALVGVFVFERYIFVSPAVGAGTRLCAACYAARLLSHPPMGITEFAIASAEKFCAARPDFEYRGLDGGLAQIVAHMVRKQLRSTQANTAVALEIGNTRLLADPVAPLHGCHCRAGRGAASSLGAGRFTAFASELAA